MQKGSENSRRSEEEPEEKAKAKKAEKAFIIGGGTSAKAMLGNADLRSAMCEYTVIGCNKSVEHIDCDIMVIHDHENFINSKYQSLLDKFDGGGGIYAPATSNTNFQDAEGVTYVRRSHALRYSFDSGVFVGGNCGCFALSIAVTLGFKEIYLIGMDARYSVDMTKSHLHEGYGHEQMTEMGERVYEAAATLVETNGAGIKKHNPDVKVFNCSHISTLDVEEKHFKRVDIIDVLNGRTDFEEMNLDFWGDVAQASGDLESCQVY